MSKSRRNSSFLPLDDTLFAVKPRKPVPHEFVLDAIATLSPKTRSMFGCLAIYVQDKIVLILRDRRDQAALLAEEANIVTATQEQTNVVQLIATADRVTARLDNLNRQIQAFLNESAGDFTSLGLAMDTVFSVTLDKTSLTARRKELVDEQDALKLSLDPVHTGSLPHNKAGIENAIKKLQDDLDEPNQSYQAYETTLKAWETQRLAIIGSKETLDTIAYYERS